MYPGLVFHRGFWLRKDYRVCDSAITRDVAENDCYRLCELPPPEIGKPYRIVDVGAHIGAFTATSRRFCPWARIYAVECNPANIEALTVNAIGVEANKGAVIQAACTYLSRPVLLSTIFPGTGNTGGSGIATKEATCLRSDVGEHGPYRLDESRLATITLDQLCGACGGEIDLLKLDCEGSEFDILENARCLDSIRHIVGEWHESNAKWDALRADLFANGWDYWEYQRQLNSGLFRLTRRN